MLVDTSSTNTFTLGTAFLKNYFVIFDNENNQVGITPHLYSEATIKKGPKYGAEVKSGMNSLVIGGIIAGGIVVLGLLIWLVYFLVTRKNQGVIFWNKAYDEVLFTDYLS